MDDIQAKKPDANDTAIQDRPADGKNPFRLTPVAGSRWVTRCLWLSGGMCVLSFFLPVIPENPRVYGIEVFITLTQMMFVYSAEVCFESFLLWLPNPLFWVGLMLASTNRFRVAAVVGIMATVCGSLRLDHGEIAFLPAQGFLHYSHLGAGYFAWEGSMLLLVVVCVLAAVRANPRIRGKSMPSGSPQNKGSEQIICNEDFDDAC